MLLLGPKETSKVSILGRT